MNETARDIRVTGRVQGVGYRAWTADTARGLNLSGWVRNEPDGAVHAVLAGSEEAVSTMLEKMRDGPRYAQVLGVEDKATEMPRSKGFEVRR